MFLRYSSVFRGTTWSIVLYSITAVAASREQHWREASQAFYRVSMVYSNLQATMCAGTIVSNHTHSSHINSPRVTTQTNPHATCYFFNYTLNPRVTILTTPTDHVS